MRLACLVLVVIAPLDACSDTLVTAPKPEIMAPTVPAPTIVIRGANAPHEMLIIVDGVVVRRGEFNRADIERVEVIKGPAAATIYGAETRCPPIIIHVTAHSSGQADQNVAKQ